MSLVSHVTNPNVDRLDVALTKKEESYVTEKKVVHFGELQQAAVALSENFQWFPSIDEH